MKKILCFVVAVLSITTASAQLTNGLVAHWSFNGNANDASGNGHNGIPSNITYTNGKLGQPNTAAVFNGSNSAIVVPNSTSFNITNYSLCAVVRPNGFYTNTCQGNSLLFRGSESGPGSYGFGFFDNAYNNCATSDTDRFVFYGQAGTASATINPTDFQTTTRVHTGNWYCVIVTYNGSAINVYVNGSLVSSANTTTGGIGTGVSPIGIGRYLGGGGSFPYWFNGLMDDLRLYNRALTTSEISQYCGLLNDTSVYITKALTSTTLCLRDTIHVQYGINGAFSSGNTFTAQLSNATGSFTTPINIGSVTSTTAGTIIGTIPANLPTGTGYRVRVVSSNPSRSSADNGVDLSTANGPNLTSSSNTPVCTGNTLQLNSNSTTPGVTYSWNGPASFTNSAPNPSIPSVTTANAGTYYIQVTAGGCSVMDTVDVVVNLTPATPTAGSNTPVCTGGDINLTASNVSGVTYSWTGPGGFTSTQQNPTRSAATVAHSGAYYVTTNANGCASIPDSAVVNVIKGPDVGAYPSPGSAVCDGDSITLIGFALNVGTGATYQWEKNGTPIPGATALTLKVGGLVDGDKFKLRVTPGIANICNTALSSPDIEVQVLPYVAPTVSITQDYPNPIWSGLLVTFTAYNNGDAGRRPKYQWQINGQDVLGATAKTWGTTTLKDNDSVSVIIESDYACPSPKIARSNVLVAQVTTGINAVEMDKIALYPNPNKGSFTLNATAINHKAVHIEVLNSIGQVVYVSDVTPQGGTINKEVHLNNVAQGVYMLRMTADGKQSNIRFVVE